MTPAIEYLVRTEVIRGWLTIPCSLFLFKKENNKKVVVSIDEEFKVSSFYSVKYWEIEKCSNEQHLPFMTEQRILKNSIFEYSKTLFAHHNLLHYSQEPINSSYNSFKSPMSSDLYNYFFENQIESSVHKKTRMNWLWMQFIRVYLPDLYRANSYISSISRSDAKIAEDQSNICKNKKKYWKIWLTWQKHMLLNSAELVFYKEYLNVNN